ncbi:BLUF domain-containing protein [Altererythrobacter sp. CAU 1778]
MRHFVYISTAAAGVGPEDIARIVETAQRNNPPRGITGFLLYNGRNFMQLLEGEQGSLQSLMLSLTRDTRHHGIVRIEDIAIEERLFQDWNMPHLSMSGDLSEKRREIDAMLPDNLDPQVRRTVLNFTALS